MLPRFLAPALCSIGLLTGCVTPGPSSPQPPPSSARPAPSPTGDFSRSSVVSAVEDWLGVSAETAGTIVERVFDDLGEPNGYIYGEEASAAVGPGLRYGRGEMLLEDGSRRTVYWQGPSIGWDVGANASKTFTLVYDIAQGDDIYRRFPGVEGSAYLIGGVGVNYQRAEGITLVPMRAGVGARFGANVGYLAYSRDQRILPF
ncbi:MAG: EipA family protein [Parvularcula sp.]